MENIKLLIEDLQKENILLRETISVQHETINRLLDTYVLKEKSESTPKHPTR